MAGDAALPVAVVTLVREALVLEQVEQTASRPLVFVLGTPQSPAGKQEPRHRRIAVASQVAWRRGRRCLALSPTRRLLRQRWDWARDSCSRVTSTLWLLDPANSLSRLRL